ncbi:alcohol dehydrogenase catalytic domain-containing protein [Oscillospiraceae bacterium MB08-C2-2]|nr:alcohol dehydrogenase catalytic domain-containing protein [Oscillospiraceae bacterium MB08-C2-2]
MKKAIFTGPYAIEFQDAEMPSIQANEVLLKVVSIGICGSDIQMYHGLHKYMTYPVIPGHEVAAVIEKVGSAVSQFRVGQRVTVEPQIVCHKCYPCETGRFNVCENLRVKGVHADGFAAEYVAVEESYLHLCPDNMDFDLITLVEPLAVGIGSVKRSNYKGASVAVIGAGTIGNLTAQAAQALGAAKVLITDILDQKLEYAKACGIEHCINTKEIGLKKAIEDTFHAQKADVIIDCAATKGSFMAALEASRNNSQIIITGNYKAPVEFEMPTIQRREVSLVGHMMYVREDFADAIRFLAAGSVKVQDFVTQRYPFEEFDDAFKFIDQHPNDVMKTLVMI